MTNKIVRKFDDRSHLMPDGHNPHHYMLMLCCNYDCNWIFVGTYFISKEFLYFFSMYRDYNNYYWILNMEHTILNAIFGINSIFFLT